MLFGDPTEEDMLRLVYFGLPFLAILAVSTGLFWWPYRRT